MARNTALTVTRETHTGTKTDVIARGTCVYVDDVYGMTAPGRVTAIFTSTVRVKMLSGITITVTPDRLSRDHANAARLVKVNTKSWN